MLEMLIFVDGRSSTN
uniref:Uncharacterized protein n=1 Tax=Arundo donax TaxID=35708 RepID=A0A0A8Y5M2_ARUDO